MPFVLNSNNPPKPPMLDNTSSVSVSLIIGLISSIKSLALSISTPESEYVIFDFWLLIPKKCVLSNPSYDN